MFDMEMLGLHGAILIAGFSGGVCYVGLLPGRPPIWTACSALLVSTLTANYLSGLAAKYIGFGTLELPAAFILALCATPVCRGLLRKAKFNMNGGSKEDHVK